MANLDLVNLSEIQVSEFGGLFSRGMGDTVPLGYFQDCLNIDCSNKDEVKTRNGSGSIITFPHPIVRIALYKRLNETSRFLILDNGGNLYDSVISLVAPIISNPAFLDFSMINFNNRAYITFHNRINGVGPGVYVYQGDGTIRLAAGSPPAAFVLGVTTSVNSGSVEQGTHLFAVVFETNSGYLTAPGPALWTQYDAPGDFKVNITNIPIGPPGTIARRIVATPVLPDYDGNQFSGELFFVPDGRIPDNTTTAIELDFFDADLYASADYLLDNREVIPAGSFINIIDNRLVLGGIPGRAHDVIISTQGQPEVFDQTVDTITVDPSDSQQGVTNCITFRNSLFITKANRTYITLPLEGTDPINWNADSVDAAIGTQCFGIAAILDAKGSNTDRWFIADPAGLFTFESGLFRKPALSFNIEDIWKRINKNQFNRVQVVHDAENFVIYVSCPLDNATDVSHILCGFYGETINTYGTIIPQKISWSIYKFTPGHSSITVDVNLQGQAVLKFAGMPGNIYEMKTTGYLDSVTAIDSFMDFGLLTKFPTWISLFTHVQFRLNGVGNIDLTLKGLDGVLPVTVLDFLPLTPAQGGEIGGKINFINEKMSVKIRTSAANEYMHLVSMTILTKPKWKVRSE